MSKTESLSPAFRDVAANLLALHGAMVASEDDTPETEALRDAMDAPFRRVSERERALLGWLSEALYEISESPPHPDVDTASTEELATFRSYLDLGDWYACDAGLRLLRSKLTLRRLHELRAEMWEAAGLSDIAKTFADSAASRTINTENG